MTVRLRPLLWVPCSNRGNVVGKPLWLEDFGFWEEFGIGMDSRRGDLDGHSSFEGDAGHCRVLSADSEDPVA